MDKLINPINSINSSNPINPTNAMNPINPINPSILLTIDVEDWFQVENFKECIPFFSWPSCDLRVERNTHRLLDLMDSVQTNNPSNPTNPINSSNPTSLIITPKATFFILGWIAERLPHLIREIHSRGHEIASHGYYHSLCSDSSLQDLRKDLIESKRLLEDIIGKQVYGYRAPSFSIWDEVLKLIKECGYAYDSSYNSFSMNRRYGRLNMEGKLRRGIAFHVAESFHELPISNIRFGRRIFPWGGGGYFRLIPFPLFQIGIRRILNSMGAYLFYMHPWEVDLEQPIVREASMGYRFRHYVNLGNTLSKLRRMVEDFKSCRFITCRQYLEEIVE